MIADITAAGEPERMRSGPLGTLTPEQPVGLGAPRTLAFTDELTTLLDEPLVPPVPNDQSMKGTSP